MRVDLELPVRRRTEDACSSQQHCLSSEPSQECEKMDTKQDGCKCRTVHVAVVVVEPTKLCLGPKDCLDTV